ISSKFILARLCSRKEIAAAFNVSYKSVSDAVKKLKTEGDTGYFRNNSKGTRYKLLPEVIKQAQQLLNEQKNNSQVAKLLNISEGTIRNAIKKGILKKKSYLRNYKLNPENIDKAQALLYLGKNNSEISREVGVTEGTIRYAI